MEKSPHEHAYPRRRNSVRRHESVAGSEHKHRVNPRLAPIVANERAPTAYVGSRREAALLPRALQRPRPQPETDQPSKPQPRGNRLEQREQKERHPDDRQTPPRMPLLAPAQRKDRRDRDRRVQQLVPLHPGYPKGYPVARHEQKAAERQPWRPRQSPHQRHGRQAQQQPVTDKDRNIDSRIVREKRRNDAC